jgi:hypothetical protein
MYEKGNSKLATIKNLMEKEGYDIVGFNWASDCSLTISLIKTRFENIGKRKAIYVPYTDENFNAIFSYVMEKAGIPKKVS